LHIEYQKKFSRHLGRDMEFKIYGHAGKPALIFPSQDGRFFQYEDFGMVNACQKFIDEGRLQLFCADGIDLETWSNLDKSAEDRINRHEQYVRYITEELVPAIQFKNNQKILVSGCSMGAFHAANFFFRRPDLFDMLIALSGLYSSRYFFGDYMNEAIYFNSVVDYVNNLTDDYYLNLYRQNRIYICTGQGNWETEMIAETAQLKSVLERKNIPAWIDFWGYDVHHDWSWWRVQMQYFLEKALI